MMTLCRFNEGFRGSSSLFYFYGVGKVRYNQCFATAVF